MANRVDSPWTAERDAELRRRFDLDETYAVIAAAMGISRNAAIARANRLLLRRIITVKTRTVVEMPAPSRCLFALNAQMPFAWCGAPVSAFGSPWCDAHRAVVFQPPKKAEEAAE